MLTFLLLKIAGLVSRHTKLIDPGYEHCQMFGRYSNPSGHTQSSTIHYLPFPIILPSDNTFLSTSSLHSSHNKSVTNLMLDIVAGPYLFFSSTLPSWAGPRFFSLSHTKTHSSFTNTVKIPIMLIFGLDFGFRDPLVFAGLENNVVKIS